MAGARPSVVAYLFGPFRLNVAGRILERNGERLQLTPKVIDTLFVLVENHRQVITKEEMMRAVWPDVNVVESGLTRNLSILRKALEEGRDDGSFIETIPRRGYRFVGDVTEETDRGTAPEEPEPQIEPPGRDLRRVWVGVSAAVVAGLGLWLLFGAERVKRPAPVEPNVRIGEHLLYKLSPEEGSRALEHFERAIADNPRSAGAHAGLSIALVQLATFGARPLGEALPRAEAAARKSLQLDPGASTAHFASAMVLLFKDWAFKAADVEFRRALQLDPASVQTRLGYARLKLATGEIAAAQRLVEEALRLDPASPPLGVEYCRVFYFLRDYRRAESECQKVLDREPGYALAHYYLALNLGSLGRYAEAQMNLDKTGVRPEVVEADRAWLSARQGDSRPALAALEVRRELMRRGKVDASAKLLLAVAINRIDEAYEAIDAGLATRSPDLLNLHLEPRFDAIRTDARYVGVLQRIGIPQNQR